MIGPTGEDLSIGVRTDRANHTRALGTRPVLALQDLKVSFLRSDEWRRVVNGVTFDLGRCETVALVGESGSGKSVTANSIMRLLPDAKTRLQGSIIFDGHDLLTLTDPELRKIRGRQIAMIFQEPMTSLNPVHPVGRQISETILIHGGGSREKAEAEALRLMDRVKISSAKARFRDYPHSFSGGMAQRAMIAMALACKPKVLIADEPTTALDVTVQAQILELLVEVQNEDDMAILFITHDMGVVAEVADRTLVMQNGSLLESGATVDIFEKPQHSYTQTLLAAALRSSAVEREKKEDTRRPETECDGTFPLASRTRDPLLRVQNLTTRFSGSHSLFGSRKDDVLAVDGVSFELFERETLSIVGESGSGKTTLGRSILRLVDPEQGSVTLGGRELIGMKSEDLRAVRKDIQMIFQDPSGSLNPRRTVMQSIKEPYLTHQLGSRRAAQEMVHELLARVGLAAELGERYPHQLSGGQRQRVCIARALALSPKIIVADESVASLDATVKAEIVDLLVTLQRDSKLSYLFISHDMAVVERISDRVAVMYKGALVEIGPKVDIFGNAQHPYTRRLLSAIPTANPHSRGRQWPISEVTTAPSHSPNHSPSTPQYVKVSADHLVKLSD